MNPIIYKDENWLVVDKPAGLPVESDAPGSLALRDWLELHLELRFYGVLPIDKRCSGLVLFALNPESARHLEKADSEQTIERTYRILTLSGQSVRLEELTHIPPQAHRHSNELPGTLPVQCCSICLPDTGETLTLPPTAASELLLEQGLPRDAAGQLRLELLLAVDRRGSLFEAVTDAFRLVHRDETGPWAIDRYGEWLLVTGFREESSAGQLLKQLMPGLELLMKRYRLKGGVVRNQVRNPHNRKLFHDAALFGEPVPDTIEVIEQGVRSLIRLNSSQHSGLFLDQRDSRKWIASQSAGKRVVNLFSFTCSFSAAAVKAGAEVVFSIDLARSALDRGKENFELNGLSEGGRGKFIADDVRKWLSRELGKKERQGSEYRCWDLVICDPPVFASGKGGKFSVEEAWPGLAESVLEILAPGGKAVFANNHRGGDHRYYRSVLEKGFSRVDERNPPLDFPSTGEKPHVRIFYCTK